MNKSLIIASFAVLTANVFGMIPNNPNGNSHGKRNFSHINEFNGEEQHSRRRRISSQDGVPARSENGLDLLASVSVLVRQRNQLDLLASVSVLERQRNQFANRLERQNPLRQSRTTTDRGLELRYAIWKGDIERVKNFTSEGVRINEALTLAARHGHEDIVKYLVESGYNIDDKTFKEDTPLCAAARRGHESIVRYFVEKGADINRKVEQGSDMCFFGSCTDETPLIAATRNSANHIKIIKYLLDKGADVNCYSDQGGTPLSNICKTTQTGLIKRCLELGADPNLGKGKHCALINQLRVRTCKTEIIEMLLCYGANKNEADVNGKTVLMHATSRGYKEVIDLLFKDENPPVYINDQDSSNRTALVHTLCVGPYTLNQGNTRYDIIKALLDRGANPNVVTSVGWTPLIYAAKGYFAEIAKLLIEKEADLDEALRILQKKNIRGKDEMIEFLRMLKEEDNSN